MSPRGSFICRQCIDRLSLVTAPVCSKCGKQIISSRMKLCHDCTESPKSYVYGVPLMNYDRTAQHCMVQLKYNNQRGVAECFGKMLAYRHRERILGMEADCLVPVPVHASRLRDRGYNQAELIADAVSDVTGIPVRTDILERSRKTAAMKELDPEERLNNLKGAFCLTGRPVPQNIVLVDDIYTTGATIEACTGLLKAGGAENVYFISICIGSEV